MPLLRRGITKHSYTPVTWAVECPIHPNQLNIEYPVGKAPSTAKVEHAMGLFYCPVSGGHNFALEDAKMTTYDVNGNINGSGLSAQSVLLFP
jgi:hypothetical protein